MAAAARFTGVQECFLTKHCQPLVSAPLLGMLGSYLKKTSLGYQFSPLHIYNLGSLSCFHHLLESQLILSSCQYCCHSPCDLNLQQTVTLSIALLQVQPMRSTSSITAIFD